MARKINVRKGENANKVPAGVKAISILFYIGTILCFVIGLVMIIGAKALIASLLVTNPNIGLETIPQGTLMTLMVVMGVLFIVMGVIALFIGRGIWKGRKWARITAIVLCGIGLIIAIFSIVTNFALIHIISILIDGYIGGYLLFSEEAKRAFK